MKLDMHGLITTQFDEMVKFYKDVMKMEVAFMMEGNYAEFKTGGTRFAISTNKVMEGATGHKSYREKKVGQSVELAFLVDSPEEVDAKYKEIVEKGATPVKDPHDLPWNQRAAFFADPDGNIHEIFAELEK